MIYGKYLLSITSQNLKYDYSISINQGEINFVVVQKNTSIIPYFWIFFISTKPNYEEE